MPSATKKRYGVQLSVVIAVCLAPLLVQSRRVAKHCVFPVFCGSGGSKSRLAKAAGADTSRQRRCEKLPPGVGKANFHGMVR